MEVWDCGEAAGGVTAAGIEGGRQRMTRTGVDLPAPCSVVISRLLRYNTKYLGTMQLKILFSRANIVGLRREAAVWRNIGTMDQPNPEAVSGNG